MAREIDFSKPLSTDDKIYVAARPWISNEARLQGFDLNVDPAEVQEDLSGGVEAETEDDYDSWTVAELRDELTERELTASGVKSDLTARLREDDAKQD